MLNHWEEKQTDFLKSDLCESDYVKVVCNFCFHYSQSALFLVLIYMSMYLLNIYFGCFFPPRCFLVLFYFVLFYCLFECIILSYIRPFPCNYNTCTLNIFPPIPLCPLFSHPISPFCAYYPPLTQTHMHTHAHTQLLVSSSHPHWSLCTYPHCALLWSPVFLRQFPSIPGLLLPCGLHMYDLCTHVKWKARKWGRALVSLAKAAFPVSWLCSF